MKRVNIKLVNMQNNRDICDFNDLEMCYQDCLFGIIFSYTHKR